MSEATKIDDAERPLVPLKREEIGYMEFVEIRENKGKCGYCRKPNTADEWFRTSFIVPGLCMDSAPCCRACAEKRRADAKRRTKGRT